MLEDTLPPRLYPTYLGNAFEQSSLVMIPASVEQTLDVPFRFPAQRQESLYFSSNQQSSILDGPEQWFDAISVSGCNQELLRLVKKDTGKLASEVMKEVEAVVLVQSNGELRI